MRCAHALAPTMKTKLLIVALLLALGILTGLVYGQARRSVKQPVAGDSSGLYFKDARGVYTFIPRDCGFLGCFGPDRRSDSLKYKKIAYADANSFKILIDSRESSGYILARDRTHVFYGGEYVPSGDVNSLKLFGSYAKDKNNLYYAGSIYSGIDVATARMIGRDFILDRNGLYVANSDPPRKADLIDLASFEFFTPMRRWVNRDYFAQDKNFYYYSSGGTFVDPKSETQDFKKLGCHYYSFRGQIFYSVYRLADADVESFKVLASDDTYGNDIDACRQFYAPDKNRRYEFELEIRPDDTYRNRQVDLLLATPEARKSMSTRSVSICIPKEMPGVNFGYSQSRTEMNIPGTIKVVQYSDARIIEAELLNAAGHWQQLPSITDMYLNGCNPIGKERFYDLNKKPWFDRRDATSVSLKINSGEDTLYIVCDQRFSVKMAFSTKRLIRTLKTALKDSRVQPYESNQPGWGSGWILQDKYFVNTDGVSEVWIPLRVKDGGGAFREGIDYVTIGFTYHEGQFHCVDRQVCEAWDVPRTFKVNFD